ncbi:SLC13 family permease [Psychrobacillus sp. NEAU-3TGS]|uniref:GntP family permease n=1 Tax=Psychrobacillus sp. NEAU-3TGS TaxID=2995412 RepID=UPI0024998888|nr:SLC13 family permease [Psychrobacillus sp. NEAU-3TGS]MDI2587591.1 SLC13 family permease [Psychrobacillus sp. NEAU-3TGS]
MVIAFIGFFLGLGLLMFFTMRGMNIIFAALIASIVVALTNHLSLEKALTENYMAGFTGYFASWFLVYLLGAVFGKIMEETGAANSIANWVKRKIGAKHAVFAVVVACSVMAYGGVSVAIVAFAAYPIALSLFREGNIPHRFIPASIIFGSISFTMTSPGSPEVQNLIPMEFFGTKPTAGGWIAVVVAIFIIVIGSYAMKFMVDRAIKNGEQFDAPKAVMENLSKLESVERKLPPVFFSILPLALVVITLNISAQFISSVGAALLGLFVGCAAGLATMYKYTDQYRAMFTKGAENAVIATVNICAVVGFGAVAQQTASFQMIVDVLVGLPGMEYIGLALAVTVIAGITGSASGGLGIALPILAPIYNLQGLDPNAMHRISALASGGLDSLPHNGYIVTTIRAVSNETHDRAYKPVFVISVVVSMIALALAIILYSIF